MVQYRHYIALLAVCNLSTGAIFDDFQSDLLIISLFRCNFSYIYAAVDSIFLLT